MADLKIKINQPGKGDKSLKIFLGGDLSINKLEDLTNKLKQIEKDHTEFEININDVSAFDLASIQLLLSLKKTADKHKKKIRFKVELPKDIWELCERTGFSKELKNL
jgi:ABC-type transporter Mla MlaB component